MRQPPRPRRTGSLWIALCAGGVLAAAGSASAQVPGWNIEFIFAPGQTGITPQTPSCIVRVEARFSPNDYALGGSIWDVLASEGDWSQHRQIPPLACCPGTPGVIGGPSVTGIIAGQINIPPAGAYADPSNPIDAWEATWTTTNFTPRSVTFTTRTQRFDVYATRSTWATTSRLAGLTEGGAELQVSCGVCYADCDTTTGCASLDIFDFLCFQNRYDTNDPYACDCDTRSGPNGCDIFDFLCFQNAFAAGCP